MLRSGGTGPKHKLGLLNSLHADFSLAALIERTEAQTARVFAEAANDEVVEIAGGIMVFAGLVSPLTHAVGTGMSGPVLVDQIDAMESFFRARGANSEIEVCPHTDDQYVIELSRRGYVIGEFQNVLARRIDPSMDDFFDPRIRKVGPQEGDIYAHVVAGGFFDGIEPTVEILKIGQCLAIGGAYLATFDGQPASGGGMRVHGTVAHLYGDATLPVARRQGLQQALIRKRIADAAQQGAQLATASTLPGSISQRNYERCGFQVLYTKFVMRRQLTN